jgi:arylsulfatase A-like enzyme
MRQNAAPVENSPGENRLMRIAVCCLLVCLFSTASARAAQRPPNVLFVMMDNLGKEWFDCYGSREHCTPNTDRLAAGGLRFENCYVTPVCSTTRHLLLTGRYPFRTGWRIHHDAGIYGGGYFDWNREVTFARLLQSAGYATAIAGKWQINDLYKQQDALSRHGFDEHFVWPGAKGADGVVQSRYWDPVILHNGRPVETAGKFGPDLFTDFAIDFMKRRREQPFLMYYPMALTHGFAYKQPVTTTPHSRNADAPEHEQFAGMVKYADYLVGRLIAALDELGLRDNTIVFVTTDNGTESSIAAVTKTGEVPGGLYQMSEPGINVPFVANCPRLIPGGRVAALTDYSDVLPTLMDLAGAKLPEGLTIDGRSLAPLILSQTETEPRQWIFAEYADVRAVRDRRFKLYNDGRLFDLSQDFFEQHDLKDSAGGEVVTARQELTAVLDRMPPDAELWFEPESISARELRAKRAAREKAARENKAGR